MRNVVVARTMSAAIAALGSFVYESRGEEVRTAYVVPVKTIGARPDIDTADQVPARIAFAPSGREIAIARKSGGGVQVWDAESGERRLALAGDAILAFGWSADGKIFAGIGKDRRYIAWSAVASRDRQVKPGDVLVTRRIGETNSLRPPALTANLDRIAVAADTQQVALYGVDGVPPRTFLAPRGRAACELAISADGQWIAAELRRRDEAIDNAQTRIGLWNTKKPGRSDDTLLPCEAIRHCNDMRHLQFSLDGATLALQEGSYCELWNVETRQSIGHLRLKGDWLAFSPDGRWLVNLDDDGFSVVEVATAQIAYQVGSRPKDPTTEGFVAWLRDANDVHPRFAAIAVSPNGKIVATAARGTEPIWLWELRPPQVSPPTSEAEREQLWQELEQADAVRGYRALWQLIAGGDDVARFLTGKLTPAEHPANLAPRLEKLIRDLDATEFSTREEATASLLSLGAAAEPQLKLALAAKPSPEVKHRIETVLKSLEAKGGRWSGEALRRIRAIQVLEQMGTAGARKGLSVLATGSPSARETIDAKAALARLEAARNIP